MRHKKQQEHHADQIIRCDDSSVRFDRNYYGSIRLKFIEELDKNEKEGQFGLRD